MTFLFCHDHRFLYAPNGDVYSPGQYDSAVLKRYTDIFGPLVVASRGKDLDNVSDAGSLSLCSGPMVSFRRYANLSSSRGLLLKRGETARELANEIKAVDGIIVRLPSEIGLLALSIAQELRKPALVEVVACVWDGLRSHGTLAAQLYAPVAYKRMQRAVAQADWVLYVTERFLQTRYPTSGVSVGVSDGEIGRPDPAVLERRLNKSEKREQIHFGMIAALFHKQKGVHIAVKAFAEAYRECPNIRLRILGTGDQTPWRQEVQKLGVSDAVEFCGTLPRGEPVLRWLDDIDVYIQASFQEGLPRALIEAMSRGCAALASDAGGTSELVDAECLHVPGDHTKLGGDIVRAANDEAWRREKSERNFNRSLDYATDVLTRRREEFWRLFRDSTGAGAVRESAVA